jgi:histidine ammonia-lyase
MTLTTHEPLTVTLGSSGVTPEDVVAVARHDAKVTVAQEALDTVAKVRAHIDDLAHSEVPAYGISTGFGALANRHIPNELRTQLQKSLIRSHAAGMGPAVEREVVRGIMFLRAKTLASGRTGVRPVVLQTMVDVLNAGITPVVREFGSLGCSGDLAPLSHCALVLMGEGEATARSTAARTAAQSRNSSPSTGSNPSPWPKRRAWPSSTAPKACWACC